MKNNYHKITIAEQELFLLPQKAIFFPAIRQLVLSDMHLGKTTHFRKHGLAIPHEAQFEDVVFLRKLITIWQPKTVLILGDLFHSDFNAEWYGFEDFVTEHNSIQFILIKGNHDIINFSQHAISNFSTALIWEDDHFTYQHFAVENNPKINFCGHTHPVVQIKMKGKQSYRLPCFFIEKNNVVLPAFGKLTGSFSIEKNKKNIIYAIAGDAIFEVK